MATKAWKELVPLASQHGGSFPWQQVGVFPVEDDDPDYRPQDDWFNYTVGLGDVELWVSCVSVEGRAGGNELIAGILNVLAAAWRVGAIERGDSVVIPLGIPDDEGKWSRNADSIWWIGLEDEPAWKRKVNMSYADWCVPVLWSSPLGWPEEET